MITKGKVLRLRAKIEQASASLPDEDALDVVELFPAYAIGTAYKVHFRFRYGEKLFRVLQAHTSQADWPPDKTPALYTEVSVDEWPEWRQPLGAEDAYGEGAKVTHNNKHWISAIPDNVWEPGVYGWEEQT